MDFGIFNLMNRGHRSQDPAAMVRRTVAEMQAAERARFAVAWFTEHHFVVLAGDHVYKQDYALMIEQHVSSGADVTVGCIEVPRMEATGFGVMKIDATDRTEAFRREARRPARDAGQAGHGAGQHGHLCLRDRIPLRSAASRRGRPELGP